jgi:hypothetical protein
MDAHEAKAAGEHGCEGRLPEAGSARGQQARPRASNSSWFVTASSSNDRI